MTLKDCNTLVLFWKVRVKPGESALAFYTAENRSSTPIVGVSTYNVTPMKVPPIVWVELCPDMLI